MHHTTTKLYCRNNRLMSCVPNPQIGQSSSAYPLGALPGLSSESYESEMADPCLPIPEIKVADKTDTSLAAAAIAGKRRRDIC